MLLMRRDTRNIVLRPSSEWRVIAAEPTSPAVFYRNYIVPLALIGPVAAFIGLSVIGVSIPFVGEYRVPLINGFVQVAISFAFALGAVFVLALIIDALAPRFAGKQDRMRALSLVGYAYTPAFIAGVLSIFPVLAPLQALAALYGLYLLYSGLPVLMEVPAEKRLPYMAVVIACAVALSLVSVAIYTQLRYPAFA